MCDRVQHFSRDRIYCKTFENLPLASTNCTGATEVVPRLLHAVAGSPVPPLSVRTAAAANPSYKLYYHTDASALTFIKEECGEDVARAYMCLKPPAYRADLFRFCALYARGGVYLDSDLHLMASLDTLYRPCANLSVGHDWPRGAVQMKILAARPRHPVMKCMLQRIQQHVAWRYLPLSSSLMISGPALLGECIRTNGSDAAFTHIDTRAAVWPYTGLRSRDRLFAYEEPNVKREWKRADSTFYGAMYDKKDVYADTCAVPRRPLPEAIVTKERLDRAQAMIPTRRRQGLSGRAKRHPQTMYRAKSSHRSTTRKVWMPQWQTHKQTQYVDI